MYAWLPDDRITTAWQAKMLYIDTFNLIALKDLLSGVAKSPLLAL